MKFFGRTFSALFVLILLGAFSAGGYFALTFIVEYLRSLDLQLNAASLIASIAALLASMIIASSIRQVGKQNMESQLRTERTAAYQRFVDVWGDLLRLAGDSNDRASNTSYVELRTLDRHLMLFGSPGVLEAYVELRTLERESGPQHPHVWRLFAMTLLEIRKDLGTEIGNLTAEQLLEVFVANSDKASASAQANAYQDLQPRVSLASNS